jgi:hypothetical protein
MTKKTTKSKSEQEVLYTSLQICNIMRFIGTDRDYVMKRYKSRQLTFYKWKLLFKKDGLTL